MATKDSVEQALKWYDDAKRREDMGFSVVGLATLLDTVKAAEWERAKAFYEERIAVLEGLDDE